MKQALIWSDGQSVSAVSVADGFWSRFRGIRSVEPGSGLILSGRAIHTFGVGYPLTVSSLDPAGRVLETRVVPSRRFAYFSGASFLLELPTSVAGPMPGAQLDLTNV